MRRLLLLIFGIALFFPSRASHIIGGEIIYSCTGGNQYLVTMYLYRDCTSNVLFPNPAKFNLYRANGTSVYPQNNPLTIPLGSDVNIPITTNNPCLIPPSGLCVRKGTYTFT